jgi:hypothetical protein
MATTDPMNPELNEIVAQRISSLIREMEEADWRTEDIVLAIDEVIKSRWIDRLEALRQARDATPENFVSDGNEG